MSYEEYTNSGKQDAMRLEVSNMGIHVPKGSERKQMYCDVTLRSRVFRTVAQSRKFDPMMPSTEPMVFDADVGVLLASRPMEKDDHLVVRLRHCDVFGDKDIGSVKVFLTELPLLYDDPLQVRAGPFFFTVRPQNFGSLPPDGYAFGSQPIFEYKAAVGGGNGGGGASKKKMMSKKKKNKQKNEGTVSMDALIGEGDGVADAPPEAPVAGGVETNTSVGSPPANAPQAAEEAERAIARREPDWGTRGARPTNGALGGGESLEHGQNTQETFDPVTKAGTPAPVPVMMAASAHQDGGRDGDTSPPASYSSQDVKHTSLKGAAPTPYQDVGVNASDSQSLGSLQAQVVDGYQLEDEDDDDGDEGSAPSHRARGEVTGFGIAPMEGMPDSIPTTGVASDGSLTTAMGVPLSQRPITGSIVHTDGGPGAVLTINRAPTIQEQLFWTGTIPPVPPYGTYSQVNKSLAQRALQHTNNPEKGDGAASRFIGAVLSTVKTGAAKLEQGVELALFRKHFPEQSTEIQLIETFRPAMMNGTGTPIDGTLFVTNSGLFFDGPLMHYGVGWVQISHYRRSTVMGDDAVQIFTVDHKVWQLQNFDGLMAKVGMMMGTRNQSKFMEALHLMGYQWWQVQNRSNPEV